MYTARDPRPHHQVYFSLLTDILRAAPSMLTFVESMNNHILTGAVYKALKDAKAMIAHEGELLGHAKRSASVRPRSQTDGRTART
jgi:flagellar protein FlbT